MPRRHLQRGLRKPAVRKAPCIISSWTEYHLLIPLPNLIAGRIVMLISIIHRVNRAQGLNLASLLLRTLDSLGACTATCRKREVPRMGPPSGAAGGGQGSRDPYPTLPCPTFGPPEVFSLLWRACGPSREDSKGEICSSCAGCPCQPGQIPSYG
jgi:hypothetical protein